MSVTIKICGINSAEAADAALRANADFVGLVFHAASPRNLLPAQAESLAARIRGRSRIVALFADAPDDRIAAAVSAVRPDFLQLHGAETPERAGDLRARFATPVIKAIAVADAADVARAAPYGTVADMLLFDARPPADAARPGGLAASFDWQLLRGRSFPRPWLLAGGLDARNVARAIEISGARGVDVSSGVESAPGVKSPALIREFVTAARSAVAAEKLA